MHLCSMFLYFNLFALYILSAIFAASPQHETWWQTPSSCCPISSEKGSIMTSLAFLPLVYMYDALRSLLWLEWSNFCFHFNFMVERQVGNALQVLCEIFFLKWVSPRAINQFYITIKINIVSCDEMVWQNDFATTVTKWQIQNSDIQLHK